MNPDVFIAVPVYRGEDFIGETLRSIRDQTYASFRVVMSVDGSDDAAVEVCRPFTEDDRFELVVQTERLGWPGNFNWLVNACDRPFFCYWQQDDVASHDYLESLRALLHRRPDAALAYTDVQWFGDRSDRDTAVEIHGTPLERALQAAEALHYVPLRGLVRSSCLPDRSDAIPEVPTSGHQQEFVYLTELAADGAFVHSSTGLYSKRSHDQNAHRAWFGEPDASRRDEWCALADGLMAVIERAEPSASRRWSVALVLDRMTIARAGRGFFYMPAQTEAGVEQFVREFFGRFPKRLRELARSEDLATSGFERPVHPWVSRAIERCRDDLALVDRLLATGESEVVLRTDQSCPATLLLGRGWSEPEPWGVWSEGTEAEIHLPPNEFSRVELRGHPFAPTGPVVVGISLARGPTEYIECVSETTVGIDLAQPAAASQELTVRLHLPSPRSPHAARVSSDPRQLGFGLRCLIFRQ